MPCPSGQICEGSAGLALATVQARQVIAVNFTYDITEPVSGQWLGTLRSRGVKSLLCDTWDVLDQTEQWQGKLEELTWLWLRRLFPILPGHWHVLLGEQEVARIDQVFRFFVKEYRLTVAAGQRVDARFLPSRLRTAGARARKPPGGIIQLNIADALPTSHGRYGVDVDWSKANRSFNLSLGMR